ncbi:ABC transporter ATP-binding protein [Georgenia satyanarayanai]|uniref:ABC transporter ATP-binding protein n=1 Tax=Georgenia satyanarayanai TaxID=860221 RepID=UPI00203C7415|nr:ABC transporter ATP-binding protein [Georgenia satyanarayanai]MCM3661741.1 ABC transporter ATP-binding protein [Georgenia satyanarayanai]
MEPVIEVRHLRKTYRDRVAVADVSFDVHPGEIVAVLGRNGAGKTTTVETVAGLRTADGGEVRVLGVDPQRHPELIREHVGIQLQEAKLPPKITVAEAVELYASFYAEPVDAEELLELLGLTEHRDRRFERLSGGLQQRLSIALALVGNPRIAILDELTTGLDPQARRETWALIDGVRRRGVTILLVTHFMDEAEHLSDRVVVIDGGRVVADGTPAELAAGSADERSFRMTTPQPVDPALLRALPEVTGVAAHGREVEVTGTRRVLPAVVLELARHDVVPDDITTVRRSLEDVFLELTGSPSTEGVPA